ncbi:MAG: diguanylate cyclase [Oligoflexia bacterium]|nr:diguanylate cyclase [Oligoflexia bacterium]
MLPKRKISHKFMLLMGSLLGVALSIYLALAAATFFKDKTAFAFEVNKSVVTTIANQIETTISSTVDKLRLSALTTLTTDQNQKNALQQIVQDDPIVVAVEIYEVTLDGVIKTAFSAYQDKFLKVNELPVRFFQDRLPVEIPLPVKETISNDFWIWNASLPRTTPLIGVSTKISLSGGKSGFLVAVGYLKSDLFLRSFGAAGVSELFITTSDGKILIHPDATMAAQKFDYSVIPIVSEFKSSKLTSAVKKYRYQEIDYLGAFARTTDGRLLVFSAIEADRAFEAVVVLLRRSALFGGIIFFAVILIAQFFARSLTKPIERLMIATRELAAGNLGVRVDAASNDEIQSLSESFNAMTGEIQKSREDLEALNRDLEEKVKERTRQLEELATKDPLTGAYNRRYFNEKLKEELKRAQRFQQSVGLIYLDIDHFKKYNDTNGHPGGDALLKAFTKVVQLCVRSTDTVSRIGGEEYTVLLPDTDVEGACQVAEKIRNAIQSTPFPNGDKQPLGFVSCSLGVSGFPEFAGDDEALVKCADEALYHIKQTSRNAVGLGKAVEGFKPPYIATKRGARPEIPVIEVSDEEKAG